MNKWYLIVYAPAYNVEKSINEFLKRMKKVKKKLERRGIKVSKLIIVNDGSTDETLDILNEFKRKNRYLKILNHKKNLGPVNSILDGMKLVRQELIKLKSKNTIVIRMDTDMEHDPLEIENLINPIVNRRADVVVGVMNLKGYPILWRMFNKLIGKQESKKYLNMKIPQFCPGFIILNYESFEKMYIKLLKIIKEHTQKFNDEFTFIDFTSLVLLKNIGKKIESKELKKINKKHIKKIKIKKIIYYFIKHIQANKFFDKKSF